MSLWKSSRLHSRAECRPTPCEYVHVQRFSHGLHTVQEECLLHNKHSRSARPPDRSQTKREDTFFLVVLCNFPLGNFRHDCSTRWERFHIPEYILGKPVKLLLLSCGGWSPALSAHYQHLVSQLEEQRPLSLCIICVCVCVSGGDCGLVPSWKMPRCSSCLCPRREITAAVEVLCGGYTQEEKVHKNPDINLFNPLPLIFHYVPSVVEEALNVCHRYKQAPGELQTHTHTLSAAFYFSHTNVCLFFVLFVVVVISSFRCCTSEHTVCIHVCACVCL